MRKKKESGGRREPEGAGAGGQFLAGWWGKGLQRRKAGAYLTDEVFNHAHIWDGGSRQGSQPMQGPWHWMFGEQHVA